MSAKIVENLESSETELWIDDKFKASWDLFAMPVAMRTRIEDMLDHAVEAGQDKKAAEIRKVLGFK